MSVVESQDDDRTIFCHACKQKTHLSHCDDCGACPGNVFCGECGNEIDTDGKPTLLCGNCEACKGLVRCEHEVVQLTLDFDSDPMTFESVQKIRKQIQLQSVVVC